MNRPHPHSCRPDLLECSDHKFLQEQPRKAILSKSARFIVTDGDRQLVVRIGGSLVWLKYGNEDGDVAPGGGE